MKKIKIKRETLVEWHSCCDNPDGWHLYVEVTWGNEYRNYTIEDIEYELKYMKEAITGEKIERVENLQNYILKTKLV